MVNSGFHFQMASVMTRVGVLRMKLNFINAGIQSTVEDQKFC